MKKFFIFLILFYCSDLLVSQIADTTDIFGETEIHQEDTLFIINPIDIPKLIFDKSRSDAFYDSLEIKSQNHRFTYQLHRLLVRNPYKLPKNKNDENPVSYFEPYKGKYIRNIVINQLDVFGPSVFDTLKKAKHWSEKFGNSIHISTNKSSIKNFLFISEKEKIDPYILADNERILRNMSNIQDARIYIIPIPGTSDSVDVKIVTKDVWPVGFGFEAFDVDYGNVSVWNNNILGFGQQLSFKAHYNLNEDPQYGYFASYKIPNIGNTFTTLSLRHEEKWNFDANKISLDREFIAPSIRLGFGAGYEKVFEVTNYITLDSTIHDLTIDYEYYNTWIGYSLPFGNISQNIRKSVFLTARRQSYIFFDPNIIKENYLYDFFNRDIYLASVGLTWQGYYNTRLVLGFGDTEDIPYGGMLKLTVGKDHNKFSDRSYFGATFAHSHYIEKFGFISNKIETGTFYQNRFEQGSFSYEGTYISPILGSNRHLFRNIVRFNYLEGYNRFTDEFIELKGSEGIRGLQYSELKGNKRFFINNELVYYSPHYLYGFRFVYFAFVDAGLINYKRNTLIKNPIHSSFGIGVRIRNERLVFNTLQIQFHFFPFETNLPAADKQFFDLTGTPKLKIPEFAERVPEIAPF